MPRTPSRFVFSCLLATLAWPTFAAPPSAAGTAPGTDPAVPHVGAQNAAPPDITQISRALPPLPTTETGWRLPLDNAKPMRWSPIRPAVSIALSPKGEAAPHALRVSYVRTPRTANGVALVLPYGSCQTLESLSVTASATPDQRLFVTLTDSAGVVWTFPTLRLGAEPSTVTLRTEDLKPDAFQNQGKTVPAEADLATMVMLTILDISGHMGAPEAECTWTLASVEGVLR